MYLLSNTIRFRKGQLVILTFGRVIQSPLRVSAEDLFGAEEKEEFENRECTNLAYQPK